MKKLCYSLPLFFHKLTVVVFSARVKDQVVYLTTIGICLWSDDLLERYSLLCVSVNDDKISCSALDGSI